MLNRFFSLISFQIKTNKGFFRKKKKKKKTTTNATSPNSSCHSSTKHVISSFVPSIVKIFRRVFCYRAETRNQIQTQEGEITPKVKKAEVVILVCGILSGPVLHYYQVLSKYSKECSTYIADTKSMHNQCQI